MHPDTHTEASIRKSLNRPLPASDEATFHRETTYTNPSPAAGQIFAVLRGTAELTVLRGLGWGEVGSSPTQQFQFSRQPQLLGPLPSFLRGQFQPDDAGASPTGPASGPPA